MKKRDLTLDAAKGVLILMVVYAHCFTNGLIHDFVFSFHMPAFLVLSGMTAALSGEAEKPLAQTFLKLIRTIGIPFLFFESLGVIQELIRCGLTLSWKGFVFNTLTMQCNNIVDWFLYALFAAKLLSVCSVKLLERMLGRNSAGVIYLAVSVLAMVGAVSLADTQSLILTIVLKIIVAHGFYAIGRGATDIHVGKKNVVGAVCLAAAFGLSCLNDGFADLNGLYFGKPLIFFSAALLGTAGIVLIRRLYCWEPIVWFGQNSLIVMGTHIPILLLARYATGTTEPTLLHRAGDMALILLLTVPIVYVLQHYAPFLVGKYRKTE